MHASSHAVFHFSFKVKNPNGAISSDSFVSITVMKHCLGNQFIMDEGKVITNR